MEEPVPHSPRCRVFVSLSLGLVYPQLAPTTTVQGLNPELGRSLC